MMDHAKTIDSQAVERYLLGELSAAEAEDFERHYFECPECALAVESGHVFIENARQVFKEGERASVRGLPPESHPKRFRDVFAEFWSRPLLALPSAAAVLFGTVALYQGLVLIPGMEEGQAPLPFQLIGETRGEGVLVAVPAGTPSFALLADIHSDVSYKKYRCLLTTNGRTVKSWDVLPPADGVPVIIVVPTKGLKPGKFDLGIYGLDPDGRQSGILSANPFEFQFN